MSDSVTFRRVGDSDLPLLHEWLNDPGVVRWWEGDDVTMAGVTDTYGSSREDQSTEHWLGQLDGQPIGWICCWPVTDGLEESEPWFPLGVEQTAAGIDYLIGAPQARGKGLGSTMIRSFVEDVVFGQHDWSQAAASPFTANVASCRALAKAGFRLAGEVTYGDNNPDGPCSLMVKDRG